MHLTINRALTAIGTQSPLWTTQAPLAVTEIAPLERPSIAGELGIPVPVLDPTL